MRPNQRALRATQALIQSYLRAVFNQQTISGYGPGVNSASHEGVLWVKFQSGSTVENVPDRTNTTWSAYPARVASCTAKWPTVSRGR